jgi:hypothetical protein
MVVVQGGAQLSGIFMWICAHAHIAHCLCWSAHESCALARSVLKGFIIIDSNELLSCHRFKGSYHVTLVDNLNCSTHLRMSLYNV